MAGRDDLIARFLAALERELSELGRPIVDTIYIGGGTPTHLAPPALERLLSIVERRFRVEDAVEWTVEANPEDVTAERLETLAGHGVNRLSLGVQSFDDVKLRVLERGHRGVTVQKTIETAAGAIPNLSIDLIFAVPGETIECWQHDLRTALSLPIQHLSTYSLTFEKGTSFWTRRVKGSLSEVGESMEIEMYERARSCAATAGFDHYEISSFARPGYRSRHNQAYWQGRPWYGAGPGAARYVNGRRELNHRSTTTYLKRIEAGLDPTMERDVISAEQSARERAAFGVRMIEGVDLDQIQTETGIDVRQLCREGIDQSVSERMLEAGNRRIRLTRRGVLFADLVASRFLD